MSAESSWTILSIDRSELRFESSTGDKKGITLKSNKNFAAFCKFLAKSDSKFRPDQESERQDI